MSADYWVLVRTGWELVFIFDSILLLKLLSAVSSNCPGKFEWPLVSLSYLQLSQNPHDYPNLNSSHCVRRISSGWGELRVRGSREKLEGLTDSAKIFRDRRYRNGTSWSIIDFIYSIFNSWSMVLRPCHRWPICRMMKLRYSDKRWKGMILVLTRWEYKGLSRNNEYPQVRRWLRCGQEWSNKLQPCGSMLRQLRIRLETPLIYFQEPIILLKHCSLHLSPSAKIDG